MNGKLAPTPDNISEADFEPQHVTRVVRCPRCQQFFSTVRRWQLACPECGYEWEEENHFDPSEIRAEDLMESAAMGLMWVVFCGIVLFVLGLGVAFALLLFSKSAAGGAFALGFLTIAGLASACGLFRRGWSVRVPVIGSWYGNRLGGFGGPSVR